MFIVGSPLSVHPAFSSAVSSLGELAWRNGTQNEALDSAR